MTSTKTIELSQTALLLIDVQQGFRHPTYWGPSFSDPKVHENINALLTAFRNASRDHAFPLVIHVQHHSSNSQSLLHASNPAAALEPYAEPLDNEPLFIKNVNSAFIGTRLEEYLRSHAVKRLVICGITTDHCVSTTTRMAANLKVVGNDGEILLVGDATAAHGKGGFDAELVHAVSLASLNEEFAKVMMTEQLLAELRSW